MADETATPERTPMRIEPSADNDCIARIMRGDHMIGRIVLWPSGWNFGGFDADNLRELATLMDGLGTKRLAAARR